MKDNRNNNAFAEYLQESLMYLSANWNVNKKNVPGNRRNPFKVMSKILINKLSQYMLEPFMEQQSMYNLKIATMLQELCKEDKGTYFVCLDNICEKNNITDVIMTFHYYNKLIDCDSHIYLLPDKISSNEYMLCILDIMKELAVRNVHLILNEKKENCIKYKRMADVVISYSNDINHSKNIIDIESDQLFVVYSKENKDFEKNNILLVHDFDIERNAMSIQNVIRGSKDGKD